MNIEPSFALKEWRAWWQQYTDLPVTWAQDSEGQVVPAFQLTALGTKVVVDKKGRIVYRSVGETGYGELRAAIEKAL